MFCNCNESAETCMGCLGTDLFKAYINDGHNPEGIGDYGFLLLHMMRGDC